MRGHSWAVRPYIGLAKPDILLNMTETLPRLTHAIREASDGGHAECPICGALVWSISASQRSARFARGPEVHATWCGVCGEVRYFALTRAQAGSGANA
jgi:hypothetical protein